MSVPGSTVRRRVDESSKEGGKKKRKKRWPDIETADLTRELWSRKGRPQKLRSGGEKGTVKKAGPRTVRAREGIRGK